LNAATLILPDKLAAASSPEAFPYLLAGCLVALAAIVLVFGLGREVRVWLVLGSTAAAMLALTFYPGAHSVAFAMAYAVLACAFGWPLLQRPSRADAFLFASAMMGAFLALASSSAGGPDPMVDWFANVLGLSRETAYLATIATRKCVHFVYYGLLALLAFLGARPWVPATSKTAWFALLWTASFAAFDELSQLASPERTGSLGDFALDLAGAAAFVWLAARLAARKNDLTAEGPNIPARATRRGSPRT
jgi:VanZ family protein